VASIDGIGDFFSAAWGRATGSEIAIHGRVHFPHSLGIFYQALTQYLGFPHAQVEERFLVYRLGRSSKESGRSRPTAKCVG